MAAVKRSSSPIKLYENKKHGDIDDSQNSNPNPIVSLEGSKNICEDDFECISAITNPFSDMALRSPQSSHLRNSPKLSPGRKIKSHSKNSSILIASISPKLKIPTSVKKSGSSRVSSPRTPLARPQSVESPTPKPKIPIFPKKRASPFTPACREICNISVADSSSCIPATPISGQLSPGRKTYVSKLYRMVSPDRRTDIMPEPFDFMKKCIAIINGESECTDDDCDSSQHTNASTAQSFALNKLDLQTLYHQLAFFRMQMSSAMMSNKMVDEQDLIKAWQLVYEAEEKETELRLKERMTADIITAHNQLKSMERLCDTVMNDAAVPLHLLNSYVGLADSYEKSMQNAKTVRRINETLASNNEYSTCLLELERVVRSLELLAEKQNMVPHTSKGNSIKSPQPEKNSARRNSSSSTTSPKKSATTKKG